MKSSTAHVLLILTAILWSSGGVLIKLIDLNPLAIAGIRSGIAAIIILAYVKKPKISWSKSQIIGAGSYAAMVMLFISATKLTTAANAILLQFTAPIYVALFGTWFLGEKTTLLDWLGIGIVLTGLGLFFLDELSTSGFWGNICALGSGFSFAISTVALRRQKSGSPVETILIGNIIAAIICLPFFFQSVPVEVETWFYIIILGVFQLGVAYILYSTGIKYIPALDAVLVSTIEPILNPLWVYLIVGEQIGDWAVIGGVLVLGGAMGRAFIRNWNKKKPR